MDAYPLISDLDGPDTAFDCADDDAIGELLAELLEMAGKVLILFGYDTVDELKKVAATL